VMVGVTPLPPIPTSPGTHSLILVNEELKVRKSTTVRVEPNRLNEVKVSLTQP